MLSIRLRRRYERTCTICGDRWVVTRRQAKGSPGRMHRPRRLGAQQGGRASLDIAGSVARFNDALEVWEGFRRCPRCGVDAFLEGPFRGPST